MFVPNTSWRCKLNTHCSFVNQFWLFTGVICDRKHLLLVLNNVKTIYQLKFLFLEQCTIKKCGKCINIKCNWVPCIYCNTLLCVFVDPWLMDVCVCSWWWILAGIIDCVCKRGGPNRAGLLSVWTVAIVSSGDDQLYLCIMSSFRLTSASNHSSTKKKKKE